MTFHRIGSADVPPIGQGTWNIEDNGASAVPALRRGLDLGLTHLDTAEMYGQGASEKIVGQAIRGRRGEVFLVSKVLPSNAGYDATLEACDRSLRHLATDHLDLYLLHWRGRVPLAETFRAFEHLVQQGKIKAYGVSNFDIPDLEEAVALKTARPIVCNQVLYHLQERAIEARVLPWCEKSNIAVVAYSPFGQGNFPDAKSASGKVLAEIGARHGKTARQVALGFLVRNKNVFAIPKSGQTAHVEENAGALGFELPPEDVALIDQAFPVRARTSLPML